MEQETESWGDEKPQTENDRRRYLKMLEQGVILAAIVISIIVVMSFLEDILPQDSMMVINVIRLLVIIILIGGLAYIAVTGIHEMRTK